MSAVDVRAEVAALAKGFIVVRPAADELLVDIDSAESFAVYEKAASLLADYIASSTCAPSPSKKANHFHITVKMKRAPKNELERVALQALFGSDLTREALSWRALERGHESVTVFFEDPLS